MFILGRKQKIIEALRHHTLAFSYAQAGSFDIAIAEDKAAIEVHPVKESNGIHNMTNDDRMFFAEIHNNLGAAYSKKALSIPNSPDVDTKRKELFSKALEEYTKILDFKPGDEETAEAYNNIGACQGKLGDLEGAVENRQKSLDLKPDYPESYVNLGNSYMAFGQELEETGNSVRAREKFERAEKVFSNAITLKNDYAEAYYSRALAFTNLGDFSKAIEDYDKAISYKSSQLKDMQKSPDGSFNSYDEEVKYRQSMATLRKAYQNCGLHYAGKGDHNKAIEYYLNAIACGGEKENVALSHNSLGISLAGMERKEQALAQFKKALELDPEFQGAKDNIWFMENGKGSLIKESHPRRYI